MLLVWCVVLFLVWCVVSGFYDSVSSGGSALGEMPVLSCGVGVVWKVWLLLIWYGDGLRCTSAGAVCGVGFVWYSPPCVSVGVV